MVEVEVPGTLGLVDSLSSVWNEAEAHLPGFVSDKNYAPIKMPPSPFKAEGGVLNPSKFSYVVRGSMVAGAPTATTGLYGLRGLGGLVVPLLSGPPPPGTCTAGCTTQLEVTEEMFSSSPEPEPPTFPPPGSGGGGAVVCSEFFTPTCPTGTCPNGLSCAQYPWFAGDPCHEVGNLAALRALQGVDALHELGLRGRGVIIGIVDGGIDDSDGPYGLSNLIRAFDSTGELFGLEATEKVVVGGWPTSGTNKWGSSFTTSLAPWYDHGAMTATNALAMAPGARIYDMRINSPCPQEFCAQSNCGRLSDALAAYDWALSLPSDQRPDILSNSWGIFRASDAPEYVTHRDHWFNRKVDEALAAGIVVIFAAGNTGTDNILCPPCAGGDPVPQPGPILGANGHPGVLTVGGVNVEEDFIAYSTPGGDELGGNMFGTLPPGLFDGSDDSYKPDIVSPSHLSVYWGGVRQPAIVPSDAGTSTSCATAAGQVALLREAHPTATANELKDAIKRTAKRIGPEHVALPWGAYNFFTGSGRIRPFEALDDLVVSCANSLTSPAPTVSVFGGGTQTLGICAGPENAGKLYLMLGSSCLAGGSGCVGLPTPIGTTPLGYSSYLQWTLDHPNNFVIPKSVGFLDDEGHALSSFTIPPLPLSGSLVNANLYHAFSVVTVDDLFTPTFLSNAVPVTFVP